MDQDEDGRQPPLQKHGAAADRRAGRCRLLPEPRLPPHRENAGPLRKPELKRSKPAYFDSFAASAAAFLSSARAPARISSSAFEAVIDGTSGRYDLRHLELPRIGSYG